MIPAAAITQWATHAPWPNRVDVEQDLILSRLMIEIAGDDLLGPELAMRGGTCLHKIHLKDPLRYSEDLDYVRRTQTPFGPYIGRLREIGERIGLGLTRNETGDQMHHLVFRAPSTDGPREIRVKIETNLRETTPCFEYLLIAYKVDNPWWSGAAEIRTFELDELMGTKLRALHQRKKGRDLFDLWYVLAKTGADPKRILEAFHHYMGAEAFSYQDFATSLLYEKLGDGQFRSDMNDLVVNLPDGYDLDAAADHVVGSLGGGLRDAPAADKLTNGAWRKTVQRRLTRARPRR